MAGHPWQYWTRHGKGAAGEKKENPIPVLCRLLLLLLTQQLKLPAHKTPQIPAQKKKGRTKETSRTHHIRREALGTAKPRGEGGPDMARARKNRAPGSSIAYVSSGHGIGKA
eukprot:2179952-Rhodomonas_salina.1